MRKEATYPGEELDTGDIFVFGRKVAKIKERETTLGGYLKRIRFARLHILY
jgi:hypothetical protein